MAVINGTVTRIVGGWKMVSYRGRIFSGEPIHTADVAVDEDGHVRVWDNVAGHWTTCHAITDRGMRMIRLAAKL